MLEFFASRDAKVSSEQVRWRFAFPQLQPYPLRCMEHVLAIPEIVGCAYLPPDLISTDKSVILQTHMRECLLRLARILLRPAFA